MKNHNSKVTNFWASLGVVLVFIAFLSYFGLQKNNNLVTIMVDYGHEERTFMTEARPSLSAWGALQQAHAHYDLGLEADFGFWPKKIDGLRNGENGKEWKWYKDGRIQEASPFDVTLEGGEVIVFRFE